MHASVRAFMHQIIDYAGLFPPAKLPFDEALRTYLDAGTASPHRWMLGRFVCPVGRLHDLFTGRPLPIAPQVTVLGQQAAPGRDFLPQLSADVRAIQNFRRDWNAVASDPIGIDLYETALPEGMARERLADQLTQAAEQLAQANLRGFLEAPRSPAWLHDVEELCALSTNLPIGLKLRCGGLTAEAFPSDAQVAFFIESCRKANRPWKATAGLHHPRRHWDDGLRLWHHGFLNVFGAGLLVQAHPLTHDDLVAILADRDGKHFHFDEDRFSWKEWSCTSAQIAAWRASGPTSFGSCSFVEPCVDLKALGLLE